MRRFSETDVRHLLGEDHRRNTAASLQKETWDVTADDLIIHWLKYHTQMEVIHFNVRAKDELEGVFFHPDVEIQRATS